MLRHRLRAGNVVSDVSLRKHTWNEPKRRAWIFYSRLDRVTARAFPNLAFNETKVSNVKNTCQWSRNFQATDVFSFLRCASSEVPRAWKVRRARHFAAITSTIVEQRDERARNRRWNRYRGALRRRCGRREERGEARSERASKQASNTANRLVWQGCIEAAELLILITQLEVAFSASRRPRLT